MRTIILVCFLTVVSFASVSEESMDVYVIDVEGGKAMLVVSSSGESMLVDAGWPAGFGAAPGRDVDRIAAAMQAAGVKQIDNLVITHLDIDHVGDTAALLARIKVGRIIDNGSLLSTAKGVKSVYEKYAKAREGYPHLTVKPGDRLPIKGIDVKVIAAATKMIENPLRGGGTPNPACAITEAKSEIEIDLEDNVSIGLLYTFGKFRMLDMADLEWAYEMKLMCPNNPIGKVDVYMASVHAQDKAGSPALVHGLRPRVAIVNNGSRKGGAPSSLEIIRNSPGLEDMWMLHYSMAAGKSGNPPESFIANLEEKCEAKWLKLSANPDGTFTVTNARNGFSKIY
jgi:competence protein ComEC